MKFINSNGDKIELSDQELDEMYSQMEDSEVLNIPIEVDPIKHYFRTDK